MAEQLPNRPIVVSETYIRMLWREEMRPVLLAFKGVRNELESLHGLPVLWNKVAESMVHAPMGLNPHFPILAEWDAANPEVSSEIMREAMDYHVDGLGSSPDGADIVEYVVRAVLASQRKITEVMEDYSI
jgi:hypothetical protein